MIWAFSDKITSSFSSHFLIIMSINSFCCLLIISHTTDSSPFILSTILLTVLESTVTAQGVLGSYLEEIGFTHSSNASSETTLSEAAIPTTAILPLSSSFILNSTKVLSSSTSLVVGKRELLDNSASDKVSKSPPERDTFRLSLLISIISS